MSKDSKPKDYFPRRIDDSEPPVTQEKFNQKMADLYTKPEDDWLSEEEVKQAELKKIAQADALKAYGWLRQQITKLVNIKNQLLLPFSNFLQKHKLVRVSIISLVLLIAVGGAAMRVLKNNNDADNGVLSDINNQNPDFTTLSPPDQSGVKDVRVDSERDSVSFQDELSGGLITVSQQPMPEDVSKSADGVAKLALSLNDKSTIDQVSTNKGVIYVARAEAGRQTVIFGFMELLIFITANHTVDNQSWADYVNNLK